MAQANIAQMRAPLEDPLMEGFASQLEAINALADASPGFVWRFQTEEGDATVARPYDDDMVLFNMSLWESVEALFEYTYRSGHLRLLARRKEWFTLAEAPALVLWLAPAGQIPTVDDGKHRLALLAANGPTPEAFTFRKQFSPEGNTIIMTGK